MSAASVAAPGKIGEAIPKTIVLVGLMGAGKSCIGRELARLYGLPFTDADAQVEAAAGCPIEDIFERYGEQAFREGERQVISRLLDQPTQVLATGGGAFMDPRTRDRIRGRAISVWLRADIDLLVQRVGRRGKRPLLKTDEPRKVLERLIEERYPVYAEADLTVETTHEAPAATVARVDQAIESYLAGCRPPGEAP